MIFLAGIVTCPLFMALQLKLQTKRDGREAGARLVSFDLVLGMWLWIVDYGGGSQTPADNSDTRHFLCEEIWPSQPAAACDWQIFCK